MFKRIEKRAKRSLVSKGSQKDSVLLTLSSNDFIFTQDSIVASVMLDGKSYLIHPETSHFVNDNGDTWSNESLRANYKSFMGAYNYVNHVQNPDKAVGFLVDAVLRKRMINLEKKVSVYYTDILVATHRDHNRLTSDILRGRVNCLSMGCDAFISTCSRCGTQYTSDDDELCQCLGTSKGKYYIDEYGQKRIIAEILGNEKNGSVDFIEASFLTEPPAFSGAVTRGVLAIPENVDIEVEIPEWAYQKDAVQRYLGK